METIDFFFHNRMIILSHQITLITKQRNFNQHLKLYTQVPFYPGKINDAHGNCEKSNSRRRNKNAQYVERSCTFKTILNLISANLNRRETRQSNLVD